MGRKQEIARRKRDDTLRALKRQQLSGDEAKVAMKMLPEPAKIKRPASQNERFAKASSIYSQYSSRVVFAESLQESLQKSLQEWSRETSVIPKSPFARVEVSTPRSGFLPDIL